jgi:type I restriction enzyme S subunit
LSRKPDAETSFVPMQAVDDVSGTIVSPKTRPFAAVAKGYTYFEEGDVLFAKITPCMQNGKHAIVTGLRGGFGFGTTEFHVLRPGSGVAAEWVHYYLRQPAVLAEAERHFTGAVGQQRVPPDFLAGLDFPLPPLPEQKRIAGLLKEQMAEVEKARKATEAQLEAARALPAAYLREVFDSPEARKWPRKRLGDASATGVDNGVFKRRTDYGGDVPIVNVSDLYRALAVDWARTERVHVSVDELRKFAVAPGDMFFCRSSLKREGVGWCCYAHDVPEPAVFECHVMRVRPRPETLVASYAALYWQLPAVREEVIGNSRTATMTTMNQTDLAAIEIPCPSVAEQERIARLLKEQMAEVEAMRTKVEKQLADINALPAALLREAFGGGM